jgi:hypothetical protein
MRRLFKYLIRLLVLLVLAFLAWAFLDDLPAPVKETVVTLPAPQAQQ